MALELITPPAEEVISLERAKLYLRVDHPDEDDLINSLISAARQRIDGPDGMLERALLTQTWDLWLDEFPCARSGWHRSAPAAGIELPLSPAQSVTYVKYTDTDGNQQTLDPAAYRVDLKSSPARVLPVYGGSWPAARCDPNAMYVRFVAGYESADKVPQAFVQYMLQVIAFWYDNRGDAAIPNEIDDTLSLYRPRYL